MIIKLIIGLCLMSVCVVIHGIGVASAMRWQQRQPELRGKFVPYAWVFIRIAAWMVILHLAEIVVWAVFYVWQGAMPDLPTAGYFSAVTYTTTGYGDLVLPPEWRLVGGIEALTGILMCGWSTGFFFAVVNRIYEKDSQAANP